MTDLLLLIIAVALIGFFPVIAIIFVFVLLVLALGAMINSANRKSHRESNKRAIERAKQKGFI